MEISVKLSILVLATLLTGLSAGLCFTWTNAVTTGLARLDDISYLGAFQQMNRSILNPSFFLVFFGPVLVLAGSSILYRTSSPQIVWMLITATVIYFLGVALVTIFGNVPINEILDKTDLTQIGIEDMADLRAQFEKRWVKLHLIRTYASGFSFLLLILVCLWRNIPSIT